MTTLSTEPLDPEDIAVPVHGPLDVRAAIAHEIGGAAMEASRHAICITDALLDEPGPRIEYVNAAYLDMFCCEPEDCIGRSPRFAQGPLTSRSVLDRVRMGLERGDAVYAQTINYRLDGEPFRLRWSIDPIVGENGRIGRYVAILADTTHGDRLRRRLHALDALTTSLRVVTGPPDAIEVAGWLVDALTPMVDDFGSVHVTFGRNVVTRRSATSSIEPHRHVLLETMPVGAYGQVSIRVHPDAITLLDVAAIRLLCGQLAWSIDRVGGLAVSPIPASAVSPS